MISLYFQGKPFNIRVIQVCALTSNAEEAEVELFCEDLLDLTPKKRCLCPYRGLECKRRKSRNTWHNRQIWPWSTEWSRAEFCQENALVIANTLFQQHKRRLYTWTSPDCQHWKQIDYIFCSQRWSSSIQSAKRKLGADCGSDELLIAKFRLKLKKVGKTNRPFRYDLNQIPYYYTAEVTNIVNGLDLIECLKNYGLGLWHCRGGRYQDHPHEKERQKGFLRRPYKWLWKEER